VDEPVGPRRPFEEVPAVCLILVPALAVDRSGQRLGQGGGYYDRFLAQHPADSPGAPPRLGVVYRSELLPAGAIPAEPFDQRLGGVFTADGLQRFEAVAGPV
jgi:5-formyltetrahydrofolate cyclo-ligase